MTQQAKNKSGHIRLWDAPIRLFHWTLAVCVVFMLITGYTATNTDWHMRIGQVVLTLIAFRILYGFVGSTPARFTHFLRSPFAALRHLSDFISRKPHVEAGHNALGGYIVLAMLTLIGAQAFSGLFMTDDVFLEGPLYAKVSEQWSTWMGQIHGYAWWGITALVASHPLAILAYRLWAKQNLLTAMLTGKHAWPSGQARPTLAFVSPVRAVVCLLLAVALVYGGIAAYQNS